MATHSEIFVILCVILLLGSKDVRYWTLVGTIAALLIIIHIVFTFPITLITQNFRFDRYRL